MKDVEAKMIANSLIYEIFIYYKLSKELLWKKSTNFLANIVKYYMWKLYTQHKYMTEYYLQTNEKIKNLNDILSNILMIYLAGKPTKSQDEYLLQILFATKYQCIVYQNTACIIYCIANTQTYFPTTIFFNP